MNNITIILRNLLLAGTLSLAIIVCMKFKYFISLEHPFHLALFVFFIVILLLFVVIIARQPEEKCDIAFKVHTYILRRFIISFYEQ